jgi:chromosome partitioning protein
LAVEALAYGLEVVVIDLDPQGSAYWKDIRGDAPPVVAAVPVPHLDRTLKAAADNGADLVIIDTAGRTMMQRMPPPAPPISSWCRCSPP